MKIADGKDEEWEDIRIWYILEYGMDAGSEAINTLDKIVDTMETFMLAGMTPTEFLIDLDNRARKAGVYNPDFTDMLKELLKKVWLYGDQLP